MKTCYYSYFGSQQVPDEFVCVRKVIADPKAVGHAQWSRHLQHKETTSKKWLLQVQSPPTHVMSGAVRDPGVIRRERHEVFDEDCTFAEDYFTAVSQCYRV